MDNLTNVPYTVVRDPVLHKSNLSYLWGTVDEDPLKIQVKNIVLSQDQSDELDLEIYFEKYLEKPNPSLNLYNVTHLKMKFHNNLHEFDQCYVYEIICKYQRMCLVSGMQEECLFVFYKQRRGCTIEGFEKCFSSRYELESPHLFFYIRRTYKFPRGIEKIQCIDVRPLLQDIPGDVDLLIGDQKLSTYQVVLSHNSEVFKKLCKGTKIEVKIDDFDVEVIKEMLNFMYTGNIAHIEMRYELLKVAIKYQLYELYEVCIEYITVNSKYENIANILELAVSCNIETLENSALKFVKKYKKELSQVPSYQDYLCRTMNFNNVAEIFFYAKEYDIANVTKKTLNYISDNYKKLTEDEEFSKVMKTNQSFAKEIVTYYCKKHEISCVSGE